MQCVRQPREGADCLVEGFLGTEISLIALDVLELVVQVSHSLCIATTMSFIKFHLEIRVKMRFFSDSFEFLHIS